MLDEPPEAQPALGLMLRLTEQGISIEDLAALDDDVIEGFMNVFDENPRLGACLVDMLPARLARRSPSESVVDVCRKLLGAATRRDLERSLSRSALPVPEVCRFGSAWKRYFCDWRASIVEAWKDFLLLGSGIRASHVEPTLVYPMAKFLAPPAHDLTLPPPTLNRARGGKTGLILGYLYASALGYGLRTASPNWLGAPPVRTAHQAFDAFFTHPETPAGTSEMSILDRLSQAIDDTMRFVANVAMPIPDSMSAALTRLTSLPPFVLPTAQATERIAPPIAVSRGRAVATATSPPSLKVSPQMQNLVEITSFWRHREVLHHELYSTFSPDLEFSPPQSEAALLNGLLAKADEFAARKLADLKLRRHAPMDGKPRTMRVTYVTLPAAAQQIRTGKLNLTNPEEGTLYDICEDTPDGAIFEAPTLMSSATFDGLVQRWIQACEARANQTWHPPTKLLEQAQSRMNRPLCNSLALSELILTFRGGLLSHEAFYLGHSALTNVSLSNDTDTTFRTYRLEFTIPLGGTDHVLAPAGTCVVGAPSGNGTTLLYLQGDAVAWRAFESPQSLLDDVAGNALNLSTALRQRLPIRARDESRKHAPLVKLTSQPQRPPIALAMQATLDTIAADGALASANRDTPSRISQYRDWLSGTSATGVEQGIQAFRQQCASAHRTLPGHSSAVSLTDVKNVVHLESLRLALSKAIPQVKPTVRTFLIHQLERTGIRGANPDQVYVQTDTRELLSIVDVVLNATAHPGTPSHLSMPILAKGADGAFRTFRKSKSTTGKVLSVDDVIDNTSLATLQRKLDSEVTQFWKTSRLKVRNVIKSEFIAQVWIGRANRTMTVDQVHIASRIAGPITLGRLDITSLGHRIDAPAVDRAWLNVNGMETSLMVVSIAGRAPCLLLAPYVDGMNVYGFDDQAMMASWLGTQLDRDTTRARIAGTFIGASPANLTGNTPLKLDTSRKLETRALDTFAALTSTYESRQQRTPHPTTEGQEALLSLMGTLSNIDLALGFGTWVMPAARPVSLAYSVFDATIGLLGVAAGELMHNDALVAQGGQSLLSAVGAQGISSLRYRALLMITGDARYKYFLTQAPRAEDALIRGLHIVDGQFYAAIDAETRAYLTFDESTGFFRVVPKVGTADQAAEGPLMRLSPSGHWHIAAQSEFATPTLEEPHVAWRIDQTFRARFDMLRDSRDEIFEAARRSITAVDTSASAMSPLWQLRMLRLEFIDFTVTDSETLGKLAGRIDYLQNVVDAGETVASSSLVADANRVGAICKVITQRPRVYLGHVRTGLLRACALFPSRYPLARMIELFNHQARLLPQESFWLMSDLQEIGCMTAQYLNPPSLEFGIQTLSTLFDGPRTGARAFEVRAGSRTLMLGRRLLAGGEAQYYFVDPAAAMVVHNDYPTLLELAREHIYAMASDYGVIVEGGTYGVHASELDLTWLNNVYLIREYAEAVPIRVALRFV
ncbi:hypothetical protein DBA20_02935 [Pandoraea capi]|nr:hypothetical protein [Pandoraea sp. LA3]MDN4581942.1 hypothetical protein [Pandoraea capi]